MDTSSNIKFNVEGDDKFSQFLEKTQKSLKELSDKTLKSFTQGFSNSSKEISNSQKAIVSLLDQYEKINKSTTLLNKTTQQLTKTFGLAFTAFNVYTNVTQAKVYFDTVINGLFEIKGALENTTRGLVLMAASGHDAAPLIRTFSDLRNVISGNGDAIEQFTTRSTLAYNNFEQKLNEVNIVFGLSQKRLSEYGEALQNGLEKNLKNSVSSITALNAAYQAASAGFVEFNKNQEVVSLAIKANKAAPGSDLFQIGGAIGKGAGILETRDIKELETTTAKWLATEQQGITTVGEMTESITDMYSALKNAGIPTKSLVDQTQGLVVAFTKLGAKIPDIATQMEAFSRNTISKSPEAQKALEGLVDAQGKAITLNQEYFGRKGVVQGIVDFAEAVGYNTEKIKAVYTETRAFGFVMKVLAQNGNLAKKSIEDISKVTSENLNEAFDSATKSSQAKMEQITNSYDEIMIAFGKAFQKRSQEGVESVEIYKELLATFKEPLIQLAQSSVAFFDTLGKITGVLSAIAKVVITIGGTLLSFRAFGLILGGITNGFKDLRKESGIIKDLYTSNQGLVAVGKQVLGIDQQRLLSQDRINKAIANSTDLEKELIGSIGKTNSGRNASVSTIQKEIDAIVARDNSIIKGQEQVNKAEESLNKKVGKSSAIQTKVEGTTAKVFDAKNIKSQIDTRLEDDKENVVRSNRLQDLTETEKSIRQNKIGEQEKIQLKEINSEKLRIQRTYSKTTLRELEDLERQKAIIRSKNNKSETDFEALAALRSKELAVIENEKQKNRTPLTDKETSKLTKASTNLTSKIDQEELILLTQKQKLQEANNLVDKETEKLNNAKIKQTEHLNRVTKSTTDLAVLQQDLNTKKNTAEEVDIAFKGQQNRLYFIQNNLRKEQATLDKIRNKDTQEYQVQLERVIALQAEEAAQKNVVNKSRVIRQEATQVADKAEVESNTKLRQLTKEQGLAEGSLIELRTKSGAVTLKNNIIGRSLIATTDVYGKTIEAIKTPIKTFSNVQEGLKNNLIDLKSNIGQVGAVANKTFTGMADAAKTQFAEIKASAVLLGDSIKSAFVSTGIGLLIAAVIGLGAKLFQLKQESDKLDATYIDFNKTLDESALKFDRANISFDKGIQGLSKFDDKVQASKKLSQETYSGMFDTKDADKAIDDFIGSVNKAIPILGSLDASVAAIFTSFSDADFIKRTEKMSKMSDFIQNYELALRGQNKELGKGNLLTETSNQKIKAKMILTGEDLEREKAANTTRIESFQAMTDVQKKELESLKGKGDNLNERDKAQIVLLEAEISRREKVIAVSKTQFDNQLKYYEARNLVLDRQNKFSNEKVSLTELKNLQGQVDQSQTALNKNITGGLDIYSSSIKDSGVKSKQFLSDLKDGSLSVKASIKSLGGEIYKVGEDGKAVTKLPDAVLKSLETAIKGGEIDGKKYSLEEVLNLKETRDALKKAGVEIPTDLKVLADKMKAGYKSSEGELKLINLKDLEKDLAGFSTLSDKYQDKKRQFLSTSKNDIGATTFSTSLKKSLRLAETDLQTFNNALDASSQGANTFVTASTQKFTKDALKGTLDLTEGLKLLGKVESEIEPKQLEKLKLAITGKNKDEILAALKVIGVETEKTLTADSIDFNKFDATLSTFVESLNAVAESGEASSEEIAKKFESFYDQMKGKVTPAAYKALTETLIGYEKAASEQRINLLTVETNALEQQKKYGLILETDYIKDVNQLNIKTTEENINNKKIELKRLLSLYKETAPQVIKAKAELETLEVDLKAKKSNNPIEIAQAESKAKFDILKKDLDLGNVTKRQYIEEELKDNQNLYKIQLAEKQKTLAELMRNEVKNAKAIKALRRSMEIDEKDHNLSLLEINRRRIEEQFKLQTTALGKRELAVREAAINGNTKQELETARKVETDKIALSIQTLQVKLAIEKKGSDKFIEIEKQLIEAQLSLRETQVKQTKDRVNETFERKKAELSTIAALEERNNMRGTTDASLEKTRKLKEQEVQLSIDAIKAQIALTEKGGTQRLALEQQLILEVNKLQRTQLDNQKDRLQQQLENRKKAFKDTQLQLEKLMVLGTSVEDSKKVRAAKEKEIQINIEGIKKEVEAARKGSTQRKDLERQLREELLKLDKQKIANKRELIEEEVLLEKTKISKIQALLERNTIGGTFEKDLDKIRALKEKETQITINSVKKQLATYKLSAKERLTLETQLAQEITNLQKLQFNNKKEKLEAELSRAKSNLDKQIALKESKLIDGGTEEELKAMESMKVKEAQLNVDSIKKQMKLWRVGSTERLALEASLQKELNNLRKASLDKEKNLIQLALDFKKTKIDISNIESEKNLLKGNISREEFEDKLTVSSQKVNLLQQEAFTKQLKLSQKGSDKYLEILKQLSQLQVDYQKSVVEDAIRQIDRLTKKQNNSIESQKQSITKQLNSSDYLTKQLQEQIKLEDSRASVIKTTSDYQIGLLEISKKTTGDVETRAKIDLQIAETKQQALGDSQALEIQSIRNNEVINKLALEREKIQLSLNKLELNRNKISVEAELRKAKLNKLDSASIQALQLQLDAIRGQYGELQRSEDLINTQISNQSEISQNQLRVVQQQQELAQKNGSLEVEQARQNVTIAGYEKQLSQLKIKGTLIEANAAKERTIGDLLTKAYDTQITTLNSRKEVMDSTLASIDTLYGVEQSMAKSDLTKDKLAKDQAKDKLTFLDFQQRMEIESFNLEKAKNKIVRERQKIELTIAEINARQALATSKVEEAKTNARRDATEEEKLAAKLAVQSAEQGIIAAKANKELSLEVIKIEEQSEKNKEIINQRNQRNQRLQAEMAIAQTTANTFDDREVAGKARSFREQDARNINNVLPSNSNVDKILTEFLTSIAPNKGIFATPSGDLIDISKTNKLKGDTQELKSGVGAFKISSNNINGDKKANDDKRQGQAKEENDQLTKKLEKLIEVIEEYIEKGSDVIINSPITVQNKEDKKVGLDINQHLYNLATKLERRKNN